MLQVDLTTKLRAIGVVARRTGGTLRDLGIESWLKCEGGEHFVRDRHGHLWCVDLNLNRAEAAEEVTTDG